MVDAASGANAPPPTAAPSPPSPPLPPAAPSAAAAYAARWRGVAAKPRPAPSPPVEAAWAFAGCVAGIGSLAALHFLLAMPAGLLMLTPSFAASAVLLYGAPASPLAQPRNVVLGHLSSALVGVALRQVLVALPAWPARVAAQGGAEAVAGTLAVALSTSLMMLCGVTHPPGAATALIAVTGGAAVTGLGFLFVPLVTAAAVVLVLAALVVNNLSGRASRHYPQAW